MRVLIIGASGFTGSRLLKLLSVNGEVHVTAIVHNKLADIYPGVEYHEASLTSISYTFLERGAFDYIFHLARISGKRLRDFGRYAAGLKGKSANRKLLANISRLPKQPKLIYLSGSLMYGTNKTPVKESARLLPEGFAKYYVHAERPILDELKSGNKNVMMLYAPWILGNGSWFEQVYKSYMRMKKAVPVYGDPQRMMSLITVEDCAGMLWHYATHADYGRTYNIYTVQQLRYRDFISKVGKACDTEGTDVYSKQQLRSIMDKTTTNSICCEVVLGTEHEDLLKSYEMKNPDIDEYLKTLC
ncbi:MAG: NAD(P)-dependent oxidoreductase [Chitinophagales bacterium]|nr:NAD(P)-dependent oxidoreductase [Chitinophagaceae bacterium]MCB9064023.1 NAD(P)-dependent oxidoreductase [Chitinophagales bacterium]